MSVRKRNEFLDDGESESGEGSGYDSEEAERRKGAPVNKRRKVDVEEESDDDSFEGLDSEGEEEQKEAGSIAAKDIPRKDVRFATVDKDFEEDAFSDVDDQDEMEIPPDAEEEDDDFGKVKLKPATPKQVAKAAKAAQKSGVVYISRVPPFMKPHTLKHYLEPHARKGLGRTFLTPEDSAHRSSRIKRGGNKKQSFVDGWVEFKSKKEAKLAAQILNGNIIGGKKGGFYHDDIWSMKYLKGFKWSHLTEQIANENAERQARMREEIRRTRKENKAFVEAVEKGKMLKGMEERGQIKEGKGGKERDFKQKKSRSHAEREASSKDSADLKRVLGKIF